MIGALVLVGVILLVLANVPIAVALSIAAVAATLLAANGIKASYVLSLVRGSHLVLNRRISDLGLLLQSASDKRVFFVLPWKKTTLVGTTEVVQKGSLDDVHASEDEIEYLIARFNRYMREPARDLSPEEAEEVVF